MSDEVWGYIKLFVLFPLGLAAIVQIGSLAFTGKFMPMGGNPSGYCGTGPTRWEC